MNENHVENSKYIDGALERIDITIKHGQPKPVGRKVKAHILKASWEGIKNPKTQAQTRKGTTQAHTPVADWRKERSDKVRRDLGLDN